MRFTLLATLVLLAAAPVLAQAQGPAPLGFRAPEPTARIDASAPLASSVAVAGARRASPAAKGALIGGLIGLGIGVLAVATYDDHDGDQGVIIVIPAMTAIGAGIGAILGALGGRG